MSVKTVRYLLDENNIVAGLGHVLAGFNPVLRLALRHDLTLVRPFVPGRIRKAYWAVRMKVSSVIRPRPESGGIRHESHEGTLFDKYRDFLALNDVGVAEKWIRRQLAGKPSLAVRLPGLNPGPEGGEALDYAEADQVIRSNPAEGTVFILPHQGPRRTDGDYRETIDWIRRHFDAAHPAPSRAAGKLRVAVNIRRGDIVGNPRFMQRLLPDAYYARVLDQLAAVLGPDSLEVEIYSDCERFGHYVDEAGNARDWSNHPELKADLPIRYMADADWLPALTALRHADILVTSRSGFSHLGGLLNTRMVLAAPMWHEFLGEHVYSPDQEGTLDEETRRFLRDQFSERPGR